MSSGSSRTSHTSAPAWSAATPALASVRIASRTHPKLCLECTQPTAELRLAEHQNSSWLGRGTERVGDRAVQLVRNRCGHDQQTRVRGSVRFAEAIIQGGKGREQVGATSTVHCAIALLECRELGDAAAR